jgi:hypothetical protein
MNESPQVLSNNKARRMQAWARAVYPTNWHARWAVVSACLAQLDERVLDALLLKSWPDVFATAEREWPEAFAEWRPPPGDA